MREITQNFGQCPAKKNLRVGSCAVAATPASEKKRADSLASFRMAAGAFGVRLQRVVAAATAHAVERIERSASVAQLVHVVSEHAVAGCLARFAALTGSLIDVLAAAAGQLDDGRSPSDVFRILIVGISPFRRRSSCADIRNCDRRRERRDARPPRCSLHGHRA
jgi:hypothetical protein